MNTTLFLVASLLGAENGSDLEKAAAPPRWQVSLRWHDHDQAIRSLSVSPDSTLAASASLDQTAVIRDITTGEKRLTVTHDALVSQVRFSPDGTLLASASYDGTVQLWRTSTETRAATLRHPNPVSGVAFSPDGSLLATTTANVPNQPLDTTVRLWRVADGKLLHELNGHRHTVRCLMFSANGAELYTGSHDQTVRGWSTASGKTLSVTQPGHGAVYCLAVSGDAILCNGREPDGLYLVEGAQAKLFTATAVVHTLQSDSLGHLVAIGEDNQVRLVRRDNGTTIQTFPGGPLCTLSPDTQWLVTGRRDGTLQLFRVSDGTLLQAVHEATPEHLEELALSPDGRSLMAGWDDGRVTVWKGK